MICEQDDDDDDEEEEEEEEKEEEVEGRIEKDLKWHWQVGFVITMMIPEMSL